MIPFLLLALSCGCEETLEVCAPCGLPSEGLTTISGDPRVDATIEAVSLLNRAGAKATDAYDRSLVTLADEFGVELQNPEMPDSVDAQSVANAITNSLFDEEGVAVRLVVGRPSCAVDSRLAVERQVLCEAFADCFVDTSCLSEQRGSCTGLCEGECSVRVNGQETSLCGDGSCYIPVEEAQGLCLADCIGMCVSDVGSGCPGTCHGDCDQACTAYSSSGECAGHCPGLCTGICSHDDPFECEGVCDGLCRIPVETDGTCSGLCMTSCPVGACVDIVDGDNGVCRGHFRPTGCDLASRCSGVVGCQEAARELAWAYLECSPVSVSVSVEFFPIFSGSKLQIISRANALDGALEEMLDHYGEIALLVDGEDPTGIMPAGWLQESYDVQTRPRPAMGMTLAELGQYAYVETRESLPINGLKGRVGMLVHEATGGDYRIAAGALSCVEPALEDAWQMLDDLVPMTCIDNGNNKGEYESCAEDRSAGLYRVLDGMRIFFDLGLSEK